MTDGRFGVVAMFTRSGILELHSAMHECLDILLSHVGTVPVNLLREPGDQCVAHMILDLMKTLDAKTACAPAPAAG